MCVFGKMPEMRSITLDKAGGLVNAILNFRPDCKIVRIFLAMVVQTFFIGSLLAPHVPKRHGNGQVQDVQQEVVLKILP
jgi:hypothetical protein